MKTKIIYIIALLALTKIVGQQKHRANEHYKRHHYVKASELYNKIYNKGDSSQIVIRRLADSYFKNSDTKNAVYWYEKLVNLYQEKLTYEDVFKYVQSLKANGRYKALKNLNKKIKNIDSYITVDKLMGDIPSNGNKDVVIFNLPLNTEKSEFGGEVHSNKLYFTSNSLGVNEKKKNYAWNNQPFLDIYEVDLVSNNSIEISGDARTIELVNTKYHEATPIFTKDSKTMYFTRNDFKKSKTSSNRKMLLKIYRVRLINGTWSREEELPFNSDEYSVGHPALSHDEKTLYFVSDMPNGFGGKDIYEVPIKDNGSFGKPKNLGKIINTDKDEMFPFVDEENTLYFSSNGHGGFGLLDIFKVVRDDIGSISVENMNRPFNSSRDDFAFIINKKENKGYFSSNRDGGKGGDDIYGFAINKASKVDKKEKKGAEENTSRDKKRIQQIKDKINSLFQIEKNNKSKNSANSANKKVLHQLEEDTVLYTKAKIVNNQIFINPVYFGYNKSLITNKAKIELDKVVELMKARPSLIIKIESFTDCRGSRDYNRKLSDKRAKSTRDYIISQGIKKERIQSAIGYGEDKPRVDCGSKCRKCTEKDHKRNRKSKFIIVKEY